MDLRAKLLRHSGRMGADVIKVEDPVRGDPQRGLVSAMLMPLDGVNFLTELPNRGKRSVGIDIKTPEGRELIYRLVDDADVFVTNYLPDVRQRLGIDVSGMPAPRSAAPLKEPRQRKCSRAGLGSMSPALSLEAAVLSCTPSAS